MTGDAGQSGVDDEPVAVLHQGVADEAELGFHTRPFAIEHGIGVARRDMRLVAPLLTAKVDVPIALAAGRRLVTIAAVPRLEALQAGPGFDERAVDREMLRREQPLDLRLAQDGCQELGSDLAFEQTV